MPQSQQQTEGNYSIDMLKKAAFVHELNCVLALVDDGSLDADEMKVVNVIIQYFNDRVDMLTKAYK